MHISSVMNTIIIASAHNTITGLAMGPDMYTHIISMQA